MKRKGRAADKSGEKNNNAKLTWENVREIRRLRDSFTQLELSRIFDIDDEMIRRILNNTAWTNDPQSLLTDE